MPKRKLFQDLSKSQKNKRSRQFMTELNNSSDASNTCDNNNESNSCFVEDEVDNDMNSDISDDSETSNNFRMQNLSFDNHSTEHASAGANISLPTKLSQWMTDYNIKRDAAGKLLKILKTSNQEQVNNLPLDPRTLLGTPEAPIGIRKVPPEQSKMYFIVFWDKASAIAPKSWINTQSQTFRWPKTRNPVVQIIKAENPKDNWFTYKYTRIWGPFETYDEAREFEVDSLNLSTNDDEGFASIKNKKVEKNKRIRAKPLCYCTTSDDDSKAMQISNDQNLIYFRKLNNNVVSSPTSSESEESDSNDLPSPPDDYDGKKDNDSKTLKKHRSSHYASQLEKNLINDNNDDLLAASPDHSPQRPTHFRKTEEQQVSESNSNEGNCHGHKCCQKLMSEMKSIKRMVSSIYLTLLDKNFMADAAEQQQKDFGLPIQTEKQLILFEDKIKNAIDAAQYQNIVKRIGGASFEKHVRNALVLTLSDVMAYQMSWTGVRSTIMAQNLGFIKLITDAIMQKWNTAENKKIEAVIKSWLQHAGDRLKNNDN